MQKHILCRNKTVENMKQSVGLLDILDIHPSIRKILSGHLYARLDVDWSNYYIPLSGIRRYQSTDCVQTQRIGIMFTTVLRNLEHQQDRWFVRGFNEEQGVNRGIVNFWGTVVLS